MYAKFCGLLALIFFSNSVLARDNYWRYENYDDGWVVMGLIGLAIIVFQSLREGFKKSAFNGLGRLTMFCFAGYIAISINWIDTSRCNISYSSYWNCQRINQIVLLTLNNVNVIQFCPPMS